MVMIGVLAAAGLAASMLSVGLMVRPVGLKQDDPAKLGHPMAGPASPAAAHAAILRRT
jgi:hypothetical protein